MPIYVYKDNSQISTNAIRNNKAVKAIYAKEQGKETVCVWGSDDIMIFTYTVTNNKITITGLKSDKQPTSLIIPTQIEGLIVTAIAPNAFKNKNKIKKVVVPDSVTSIGYTAFWGCTGLTSVTIPNSVTSIGGSAFYDCSGLTNVTIPNSVTSIEDGAFWDCTGLTTVNWNATECASAGAASYPIFRGCYNLATVNIGKNVKIIPPFAFKDCTGLTSVTIPDSVTSIGHYAFEACTGLTSIVISDSVTSIGNAVFRDCTGLTRITFNGTKAQWNAIYKGSGWNSNTGNYTIHCTDGDIPK